MSLRIELEELEQKFRESAMKKYGYEKGSLKKAAKEAIRRWIREQDEIPVVDEPFALIEGILEKWKGKTTAVEMQHAKKLWMK